MKIFKYVSDLHLELRSTIDHPKLLPLWDFKKSSNDDYFLALVGDIGNPFNNNLELFLNNISPVYNKIFYVPGNHEYYNFKVNPAQSKNVFDLALKNLCNKFDNILLLNNESYILNENIKIIGSTLWSNIPSNQSEYIQLAINDYRMIKKKSDNDSLTNIDTTDTNAWNAESVSFIEKEINNCEQSKSCIVLTHHAPLFTDIQKKIFTCSPEYIGGKNNFAFHNDLHFLFKKPVVAWIYGHTHYVNNCSVNNIILATNQLGYSSEESKLNFSPYAYLNLNDFDPKQLKLNKLLL